MWALACDLEENFGTFKTACATYDRMIELKVATSQGIINYAQYLSENKYYEKAFKVYEKGTVLFNPPYVYDIWLIYLRSFVKRYKEKKLER